MDRCLLNATKLFPLFISSFGFRNWFQVGGGDRDDVVFVVDGILLQWGVMYVMMNLKI